MASESELADLYITLRAVTAPLISGFERVAAAGEDMVAALSASLAELDARIAMTGEAMAGLAAESKGGAAAAVTAESASTGAATAGAGAVGAGAVGAEETAAVGQLSAEAEKSAAVIEAENQKLLDSAARLTAGADEAALQWSLDYAKMAAATTAATDKMAAADAKAAESLAGVDRAASKAATTAPVWQQKLGHVSGALLKVGAAGALLGGLSIHMAADFQTATDRIATSGGETKQALDAIITPGLLQDMGRYGVSAGEITKTMYKISSGGFTAARGGLDVLKASLQGGKMEGADFVTAADAVTDVLTDYHLKGKQAATVMSQLVEATSQGKVTLGDLAASLHSVVPQAAAMNVKFADIAGAFAEMTEHGMSAQQTTQNLSHALSKMQTTTSPMRAELAQLHISATDLNDSLSKKGLTGTLDMISRAIIDKMGPAGKVVLSAFNQSKTAAQNFTEAIKQAPAPVADLAKQLQAGTIGYGDYQKAIKALPTTQYALATSFMGMYTQAHGFTNSLKNGSPQIQSYAQALQAATGDSVTYKTALMLTGDNATETAAKVKKIGAAAATTGGDVKGWSVIQNNFNQRLSEAKGGLEAAAISIGTRLLPAATAILKEIGKLTTWLAGNKAVVVALSIAIGVMLVGGMVGALGKLVLFGASMAKNLISPITGSIGLIRNFAGSVEGTAGGALRAFAGNLGGAVKSIGSFAASLGGSLLSGLRTVGGAVVDLGRAMGVMMVNGAKAMVAMLVDSVIPALGDAAVAAYGFTVALLTNPITWIVLGLVALGVAIYEIVTHWKQISAFLTHAWNAFISWGKHLWQSLATFFFNLLKKIGGFFKDIWNDITGWLKKKWEDSVHKDVMAWNAIVTFFTNLWDKVSGFFKKAWSDITGWLKKKWEDSVHKDVMAWNAIVTFFTNLWDKVKKTVTERVEAVTRWLKEKWNAFTQWWTDLGPRMKQAWQNAWDDIMKVLRAIPKKIGDFFRDAGQWLVSAGKAILDGLLNGLQQAWNNVTSFVGGIGSWISSHKGPIEKDRTLLTPHGHAIMDGLLAGLKVGGAHVASYLDTFTGQMGSTSLGLSGSLTVRGGRGGHMVPGTAGGGTGGVVLGQGAIQITIMGSVQTEQSLVRAVQQGILQLSGRNSGFGLAPAFQ